MRKRLPELAELYFIETTGTGTVHIEVRVPRWMQEPTETVSPDGSGGMIEALLSTPTIVQCGVRTFPDPGARHQRTDRFFDGQLCGRCYKTLHEDDQPLAFEHEQPIASSKE